MIGCTVVNFDFTPTAIDMLTFSAWNESIPAGLALAALGLLVLIGILLSGYAHYRMRKKTSQPESLLVRLSSGLET